jgi:hypothetical protein
VQSQHNADPYEMFRRRPLLAGVVIHVSKPLQIQKRRACVRNNLLQTIALLPRKLSSNLGDYPNNQESTESQHRPIQGQTMKHPLHRRTEPLVFRKSGVDR